MVVDAAEQPPRPRRRRPQVDRRLSAVPADVEEGAGVERAHRARLDVEGRAAAQSGLGAAARPPACSKNPPARMPSRMKSGRVLRFGTTRYQWPSSMAVVTVPIVIADSRKLAAVPYGPQVGGGKA